MMTSEEKALVNKKMVQKVTKMVPPDGGWGWMVLIGAAIANIFFQSMLSLFGLLYGDALEAMGHKTQGAAIVLSTMLFVTNFGGPVAGAIIKLSSPRVVAVAGACFSASGIFFSGFSTNIVHLVLSYGVLLGLGLGFIQNSTFVAINSYFKLRKSRAVGIANAGTGVGQTVMPHIVRYLLENYGFQGTCMLLSALSLHGVIGTLLIQPVEWHMKKVEEEVEVEEKIQLLDKHKDIIIRKDSKVIELTNSLDRRSREPCVNGESGKTNATSAEKGIAYDKNLKEVKVAVPKEKESWLKKLYDLLDISLLTSLRFLNVLLGVGLALTSLQNFSMLFPFFLQKVANMDKNQTAICMSAVAGADICGRLTLPIVQDKYKIKARWMFIWTSVWLIFTRQILAYQTDIYVLIVMSVLYGFGKSMIAVGRNLVIAENCRIDQVPAAVGLGMLATGIIVPPAGYFLGWIRDYTDSYLVCITGQNVMLGVLLATWIPDMVMLWMQERKERSKKSNVMVLS